MLAKIELFTQVALLRMMWVGSIYDSIDMILFFFFFFFARFQLFDFEEEIIVEKVFLEMMTEAELYSFVENRDIWRQA